MLLLALAIRKNSHQKSDMLKLWVWVLFLRFEWNGSMCLWTVGTSWRQPTMFKPKIQKFGSKKFWPPFFVQSRGNELWCSTVPFHTTSCDHCAWYPSAPQLGRCLGGEIHLIFWALRIVVFFNWPRPRSHVALSRFCLVGQHERKDVIHAPALFVFGGCCLENSGYLKMWPEEFNQSKLVWPTELDLEIWRALLSKDCCSKSF